MDVVVRWRRRDLLYVELLHPRLNDLRLRYAGLIAPPNRADIALVDQQLRVRGTRANIRNVTVSYTGRTDVSPSHTRGKSRMLESARPDPCGGCSAMSIPTANLHAFRAIAVRVASASKLREIHERIAKSIAVRIPAAEGAWIRQEIRRRRGCVGRRRLGDGQHPNLALRRVNVDFSRVGPRGARPEARRLGVTPQALVKLWIVERLERAA
jgi:hypothetical protein